MADGDTREAGDGVEETVRRDKIRRSLYEPPGLRTHQMLHVTVLLGSPGGDCDPVEDPFCN